MRRILVAVTVVALLAIPWLSPTQAGARCDAANNSGCDLQSRIVAANTYLATRPGVVGYVLRDRVSGLRYANPNADKLIWTASTIKLAMVVDLLSRERAGAVRLSAADRQLMVQMLRESDNAAADTLWTRYGGADHRQFNTNLPRYGMTGLQPQPGFGEVFPYWGFQKSTTSDLDRLMNYILTQLNRADAAAIVAEMQRVAANQRWGVRGAGPAMKPGNKNGWSQEQGGYVANSVGFAGDGQRYTLAIMNSLNGEGGHDDGVTTTTRLSQILLGGPT